MLKTQSSKLLLISFILFCHVLSILTPASAGMHASQLNTKNKDLAAICSGTGKIKWIKLSEYYQTGKITFVEPPSTNSTSNDEATQKKNNCPLCSLYSYLDKVSTGLPSTLITLSTPSSETRFSFVQHFTKRTTLIPSSRDPPYFS